MNKAELEKALADCKARLAEVGSEFYTCIATGTEERAGNAIKTRREIECKFLHKILEALVRDAS